MSKGQRRVCVSTSAFLDPRHPVLAHQSRPLCIQGTSDGYIYASACTTSPAERMPVESSHEQVAELLLLKHVSHGPLYMYLTGPIISESE